MEKKMQTVKSIYGIGLAVLTGMIGLLFIVQTWSIFLSASSEPYTVSIIREKFLQIAIPVALWVLAVIAGGIIWHLYPDEKEKIKAYRDVRISLVRMQSRVSAEGKASSEIKRESRFRNVLYAVGIILCAAASAVCLGLLLYENYTPRFDSEFFTGHGAAADRLVSIFPWILAGFVVVVFIDFLAESSRKKEWERLKTVLAKETGARGGNVAETEKERSFKGKIAKKRSFLHSEKFLFGLRIGFAVIGITLFIVGIANGGMVDVYEKAKNICTQCIGLG